MPEIMSGGAALADLDRDGDLDAFLIQAGSVERPAERGGHVLYSNRGDGTFERVPPGSGADIKTLGNGVAAGDYDNDGDVDLYVTNLGANTLLRNDGGWHFTDVTAKAGVGHAGWGTSATFLDFDADGDLDLFACNYLRWSMATERDCYGEMGALDYCSPQTYDAPAMDVLYRNDGNGTFTDVTIAAGLGAAFGTGLGVVPGDFDDDGRVDLFVANDGMMNQLWLNRGKGHFEDAALRGGCAVDDEGRAKAGMGVAAQDADDDGDLDLLVVNLTRESDSFFRNGGKGFTDQTVRVGLATPSRPLTRFGLGWIDFNNDGWLDIFEATGRVMRQSPDHGGDSYAEPSVLLRGSAEGRYEVIPNAGLSAAASWTARPAAFGDVDGDGGIDILLVARDAPALLLHDVAQRGHWLLIRAVEEHGRDALGATIWARVGARRMRRDVCPSSSYQASSDPRVHFGLGKATRAGSVTLRWIDGTFESFGDLEADQIVTLHRGEGQPVSGPPSLPTQAPDQPQAEGSSKLQ